MKNKYSVVFSVAALLAASACFATNLSSTHSVYSISRSGLIGAKVMINVAGSYSRPDGTDSLSCQSNSSDNKLTCSVEGPHAKISDVLMPGNFAINPSRAVNFESKNSSYINITYKGKKPVTYKPSQESSLSTLLGSVDQSDNSYVANLAVDSGSQQPDGTYSKLVFGNVLYTEARG